MTINDHNIEFMRMKTIYDLKLHEILVVEDGALFTTVMAVDGGWIYRSYDKSHNIFSMVFVCKVPYGESI